MEEDEHYKGHSAELMIALQAAPIAMNILFTNWLVYSMAKALQKDAMFRLTANFGNVTEKVRKKYDKETYSGRLRLVSKGMAWMTGMAKAYGLGNTGSYGVCLFSRCSAEYEQTAKMWLTKIFDPRVGSLMKLSPGLPDILIASNKGYVDVAGEKGINLFSTETVAAESEDIILQARSQAAIAGNGASINLGLGSMSAPPPLIPTNEIEMDGQNIHIGTKKATKGIYVNGEEILVGITDPFRNMMDKPWKGSAKYLVNYASEYIGIGKEPSDMYGASSAKNINLIFTKTPRVDVSSTDETNIRSDKNVNIGVLKPPDKPTQNVTINALKKVTVESQKDIVVKSNATINLDTKMMLKARGMKIKFA